LKTVEKLKDTNFLYYVYTLNTNLKKRVHSSVILGPGLTKQLLCTSTLMTTGYHPLGGGMINKKPIKGHY